MDRIAELTNKMRAGQATPADVAELKGLMASPQKFGAPKPLASEPEIKKNMSTEAQKALNLSAMAEKPTEAQLTGRAPFTDKSYKLDDKTKANAEKIAAGDFGPVVNSEKVAKYQKDIEEKRLQQPTIELAQPDKVAPKSVAAVKPQVKEEIKTEEPKTTEPAKEEEKKKSSFGEKLKKLGTTYGLGALDILQAVGYQRGNINKPTNVDLKYQAKLNKEEKDYIASLDAQKLKAQQAAQIELNKQQQEFDAAQAALDRLALKESTGAKLSAEERMLRMQLSGKTGGSPAKKSLIPE